MMRRTILLMTLFTAPACFAQEGPPAVPPLAQEQAGSQENTQLKEIMVPAATKIQVTLTIPIHSRSTHRGDAVRAVVAFPVTVGAQLAIPAGAYVEGTVERITKPNRTGFVDLQIHFTRIVFTNGYTVPLDALSWEAKLNNADANFFYAEATDGVSGPSANATLEFAGDPAQTLPPLPPLPRPKLGLFIGIAAAGAAVAVVTAILLGRHRGDSGDYTLYDVGAQFDLVLQKMLVLDTARVAAAVNAGN